MMPRPATPEQPRRGPHVLVVLHESELKGASRAVIRVLPLMERRGWRFSVWAPRRSALSSALLAEGRNVSGPPRPLAFSWRTFREPPGVTKRLRELPRYGHAFRGYLEEQGVDLVHANTINSAWEARLADRAGVPTIAHVHEHLPGGLKGCAAATLIRQSADSVITVSVATQRRLRSRGITASVVHNGVAVPRPVARRGGPPVVVGTVGTLSPTKGSDVFVEVARAVQQQMHGVIFRLIGAPDPRHRTWSRSVIERACAAGVQYAARADVPAELATWDIFVLPSRQEAFPLAVLEAMASGVPVVAHRVGGVPEQITPGTGVLIAPGDQRALVAALIGLIRDPERRLQFGAAGRARVTRHFSLERQAEGIEQAYLRLVAHPPDGS